MVAIGAQDALHFPLHKLPHFGVPARRCGARRQRRAPVVNPISGFGLQVDAQPIGCLESRFRRTPRVESHVVKTILLDRLQHARPLRHRHRRVTGARIDAAVECAAQEDRPPIDADAPAIALDGAKTEELADLVCILLGAQIDRELIARRGELVPCGNFLLHRQRQFHKLQARRQRDLTLRRRHDPRAGFLAHLKL